MVVPAVSFLLVKEETKILESKNRKISRRLEVFFLKKKKYF